MNDIQSLWRAVIWQAIHDATFPSTRADIKKEAKKWLEGKSKDFYYVCDLAGISAETIKVYIEKKNATF